MSVQNGLVIVIQCAHVCPTGQSVQAAVDQTLQYMLERVGGRGGAIAVTTNGEVGVAFNTSGMAWSTVKDGQLKYGVYPGESTTMDLN